MKAAQGPPGGGWGWGATLRNVTVDIHVWGNPERVRSAAAPAVVQT